MTSPRETLFLQGGTVLTLDHGDTVVQADVLVRNGRIAAVGRGLTPPADARVLDVTGRFVLPGFVQTHIHLCQSLWRNLADDLALMDWLRRWTWPMEAAHDPATIAAAARLGCAELLLSGTTTLNDMGTVRHTEALVRAAAGTGIRGVYSKVLMDQHDGPDALKEDPDAAVAEALALADRLADEEGRIRFALAPRFAVSSSLRLLQAVAEASRQRNLRIHTHCAETRDEVALTVERFGKGPIPLFDDLGILDDRLLMAHCVYLTPDEIRRVAGRRSAVLHCPSSNCKLGSGIAPIPAMLEAGVRVSLGADGAPCNNNLSAFEEMRLAALVQKALHGPTCMPAARVLRLATVGGAEALGLQDEIGSIEVGKRADLQVLDPGAPHSVPHADPAGAVVYSMGRDNVRHVVVDGRLVVEDGRLRTLDPAAVVRDAREASARLVAEARRRAGA